MQKTKKDHLIELTVRQIRLEAKTSSIDLYSRKNKEELVELILKHRDKELIEDKHNDERIAEEERFAFEKAKSEVEKNVIVDKNSNLKRILSESFPNKKISITDNKDGSQTILIY